MREQAASLNDKSVKTPLAMHRGLGQENSQRAFLQIARSTTSSEYFSFSPDAQLDFAAGAERQIFCARHLLLLQPHLPMSAAMAVFNQVRTEHSNVLFPVMFISTNT